MKTEDALSQWQGASPDHCTNKAGHPWTGEVEREGETLFFLYRDNQGNLYESNETPAVRVPMGNAAFRDGAIMPRTLLS